MHSWEKQQAASKWRFCGPEMAAWSASFPVFIIDNSISMPKQLQAAEGRVDWTAQQLILLIHEAEGQTWLPRIFVTYLLKNTTERGKSS